METSLFFAQIYGVYFIVMGVLLLFKQRELLKMVRELIGSAVDMYVVGSFLLILGLLAVLSHNVWDGSWRVIITVLNWILLLKGLLYLFACRAVFSQIIKIFDNPLWFTVSSVLVFVIGVYLVSQGFAF